MRTNLSKPLTLMRGMTTRGLAESSKPVDREGGNYGAGLIRGFAVVTRGEALGHGVWLDAEFIRSTRVSLNKLKKGAKSRFTHPGLSADGLAKFLGRSYGGKQDGDIIRSDLHLSQSARRSPDGNLAEYVLDRAAEDPESFGASIVYEIDMAAEEAHFLKHGGKIVDDPVFGRYWDASEFKSPDSDNQQNLPHARLARLRAVDVVDNPAANPSGMFGADPVFAEADHIAAYALGLSDRRPAIASLDIEPKRIKIFAQKFLDRHGLELTPKNKEASVPKPNSDPAPISPEMNDNPPADPPASPPVDPRAEFAEQHKAYVAEFGAANGSQWLADGKSIDECRTLHAAEIEKQRQAELAARDEQIATLTAERDELQTRIDQAKLGEAEHVEFSPEGGATKHTRFSGLPDGVARYAASLKICRN